MREAHSRHHLAVLVDIAPGCDLRAAVDQALADRTFLLGEDFSAADIMMGYTLRIHQLLAAHPLLPNLARYWASLTQRTAYLAADKADQRAAPA